MYAFEKAYDAYDHNDVRKKTERIESRVQTAIKLNLNLWTTQTHTIFSYIFSPKMSTHPGDRSLQKHAKSMHYSKFHLKFSHFVHKFAYVCCKVGSVG